MGQEYSLADVAAARLGVSLTVSPAKVSTLKLEFVTKMNVQDLMAGQTGLTGHHASRCPCVKGCKQGGGLVCIQCDPKANWVVKVNSLNIESAKL